jgi:F-type H+-transporting ATPase subunit b
MATMLAAPLAGILAGAPYVTQTPEFWVAVAFFFFIGLLIYYKVPALVGKMLDDRAAGIAKELDEARRLREEAEALLAEYKAKTRAAEDEARSIVDQARREADALTAETRKSLAEALERRTRIAEEKIARAEAQAIAEVRAAAIDTAVAASRRILQGKATPDAGAALIDQSIRDLKSKLN